MKIGITERGDAGLDLSWVDAVESDAVDGAVLITKNLTRGFVENAVRLHQAGKKLMVHAGCTGWGSTWVEPHVPNPESQLASFAKLVEMGFPLDHCVLRVDPIIPTDDGIRRARYVIGTAKHLHHLIGNGSDGKATLKVSIYDEYRHVKARLRALDVDTFYPGDEFQADDEQIRAVAQMLAEETSDVHITCCAEPALASIGQAMDLDIVEDGCVSKHVLDVLGLEFDPQSINPQGRFGCHCLQCKTELLSNKKQCPHKCVYCYWRK